ncbi:MAG: DUF1937 family protein [Candidatus Competibacteraceae bacterium]|nr:DUF1937 family protein [Candidatus Competibacteraceae bacterium]
MIYIASPYSSPDRGIQEARFEAAEYFTAYWLQRGRMVFSPIVYCHRMAAIHHLPTDFTFWRNFNEAMLDRALELWVLKLDGWQVSDGVSSEMKMALARHLPLSYHDPV